MTSAHSAPFGIIGRRCCLPALAWAVRLRDGRRRHAARRGRADRHGREAGGPHPKRCRAADDRRAIMSVLLDRPLAVTTLLIPTRRVPAGRRRQRLRPWRHLAHSPPRRGLRDGVRRLDDRHLVRRRVRHGRPAEHRAARPAPLRHGPGLGAVDATAGLVPSFIAAVVTLAFGANVDEQAGAYATGVLALMTSAAIAVFLTELRRGHRAAAGFFAVVSAIFVYTITITIRQRARGTRHRAHLHRPHHRHQRLVTHRALDRAAGPAGRQTTARRPSSTTRRWVPSRCASSPTRSTRATVTSTGRSLLEVRMQDHLDACQG